MRGAFLKKGTPQAPLQKLFKKDFWTLYQKYVSLCSCLCQGHFLFDPKLAQLRSWIGADQHRRSV